MSNPARQRGAPTPVCTAEAGTPNCGLHCALIAEAAARPRPKPHRRHPHRAALTQALPEVAQDLKSSEANCKSSESGRSRAAPGAQRKQTLLGAAVGWPVSPEPHGKRGQREFVFLEHHQHPRPRPPHTLLGQAEDPGQALPEDQLLFQVQCRGPDLLPFISIFIFITGRHPTLSGRPGRGGHAPRMRSARRARVLLKDTAGRLPEVPVLRTGSGFTCQ